MMESSSMDYDMEKVIIDVMDESYIYTYTESVQQKYS
jgi:hypothetical protein